MPEKLKLKLVSPAGSPAAVYSWPLQISDTHNEAVEIVETIRWVCKDFPDLQLAVDINILSDFDPNDYESMKQLCDKYNKAITNIRKLWSGREPPPCINAPPSVPLLKHIMNQVYNHAISNPDDLNQYEPFSPEVYGETTFELVDHIIRTVQLGEDDVFLDLGSGVGNVVLQVASTVNCKECIGIEKAEIPSAYAQEMEKQFLKWTAWYGKSYGDFELLKGDFLSDEFTSIISRATVIFANNYVFGPTINHQLKLKFANLPDNCRIVSSREFCPLNFRITDRNLDDIGSMMRITQLSLPGAANSVSWTNKPISFYLHVVDRSKLEEYFRKQKYPEEYPSSSTPSPEGDQDDDDDGVSNNPLDRTFKSSITTEDTSDEDFDAGRYSTPQGRKELELNRLSIHKKHKAQLARQRKLHPIPLKRSISIGMQKSRSVVECAKRQQKRAAKARGVQQSPRLRSHCLGDLSNTLDLFREQMLSYVQDMQQPQYTDALQRNIEKEELRNKYLHMVMTNLDSEVKELSSSTVDTMKQCMAKLGMTEFTPAGLLEGAKAIVTHNRELRNNVQQLEQSVNRLQIQQNSLKQSCSDSEKRASDKALSPSVAMDTGSRHISESSLHVESHDQSPASSISRDLEILTSPASNIVSPPIMSPRRGQNKSKQLATSNSKKELEIAEILSMLGSSPTKILVAQPERIDLERSQLYSDLESCTVSIKRVEQQMRHCVAPQEDVPHNSHTKENTLPVKDVQKKKVSPADLPLASSITLPTSLTLSLPTALPAWTSKSDSLKPWTHTQKVDKVLDKLVNESSSIQPLSVFAPRVFNNMSLVPSLVSSHHNSSTSSNSFIVTSTAVGPSSSTHVTTSVIDPIVPPVILGSQYATNSNSTAVAVTTTTSPARSLSNKFIIGGLSSNDTSNTTTTTTSSYMPIHTVLPFSFIPSGTAISGTPISMPDTANNSRYIIPPVSNNPVIGNYPMSSAQQQPHVRPPVLESEEERAILRRLQKKRNKSSTDAGSSMSLDAFPQITNPEHVTTPTRSQAGGINFDLSMGRLMPAMMSANIPSSSSISNDTVPQPDLTKTPLLAYPYQPNLLPYMLGRPMMPSWLEMQQKLNPTSTIRPPIYPTLMQSSPLIGFDPTGTLFKPQPQFPNLLSSPFLPTVSFGNSIEPPSLQQPSVRPFLPSNPATPTSTLSPTPQSSCMPMIAKESPLLHSSFTNLTAFGGNNSSLGLNRATATPPIMSSSEVSPGRSALTSSWPFNTQVSPMLGFGLGPGKFGSGSNQSSPLLGMPHAVLPPNGSPLLRSQLGSLAADGGGSKKDNNSTPASSQPVPDTKHSRRHYHHHQSKEQISEKNDPKHKPGVITFVGHNKPSVTISNTSSPASSDCYVVPSPGISTITTTSSSNVLTTNISSPAITSEHQSTPKPPTSVYEMVTPTVLPFQALVSKMIVKKPRSKKQTKATSENKDNSPKRSGRRGRKPAATTSMSSIITASVVEKLAGTPLLDVIAPSGLDMRELPGNKKEVKSFKETPLHPTPLVIDDTPQRFNKSLGNSDHRVPTTNSPSQLAVEVAKTASDASPAKLDSACSLLSLSQSAPKTLDTSHSTPNQPSPVIIADKKDDSEAVGQIRRPSSVTAAEAMLMIGSTMVEEKHKVIEKIPSPISVTKHNTDENVSIAEASTEDIIVVHDEPEVIKETDQTSRPEPVCEEKIVDNSKKDCVANCTATEPSPVQSSPSLHNEPKPKDTVVDAVEDDVPEKPPVHQSLLVTDHNEGADTVTVTDNVTVVDNNSTLEENAVNVESSDTVLEDTTLQNTKCADNVGMVEKDEAISAHGNDQTETPCDTKSDACDDTKVGTWCDIKNSTYGDLQDDATIHMNQLAVTEVEISVDNDDDSNNDDDDNEVDLEESTESHTTMEEVQDKPDVQDNSVTDGTGDKWEEVSDDELLDTDLTPPLSKKPRIDDSEANNKPTLTLNLPPIEDSGNNATVSSEASTPLLDDNIGTVPVRQVSVSSCISLYDDAMFEGDTFETTAISNSETINGGACENGVDDAVVTPTMPIDNASKPDSLSKIKQINPTIMARRRYRTQSIDSEGSSYRKESRRDTNTLTLPDSRQERNKSTSPRRKLQPDSTTSPKELETDLKESLHNSSDRNEWNSRTHRSRERGRNSRKQPHKNYGEHYDRQGGNQRYPLPSDYRGKASNTRSSSHHKHSNNSNNYNNQHHSHWSSNQQQVHPSEQDGRRSSNYKRHTSHHRQDSNKNSRNSSRDSSQRSKRDYYGRKQDGCDSASYRGSNAKFQHYPQDVNTTNHYNNRPVQSHYSTQSGRHGDRSYDHLSDEEPSSTAAGFKHQPPTGMLSISEASNSAVSDNSNSGSASDSELESNHSSASRPVSRASSVKSSSSRSTKERVYSRKEPSLSQRNRHHPYHHTKHNSTAYNSRRH